MDKDGKHLLKQFLQYIKQSHYTPQSYLIIDNGGLPFKVNILPKTICILERDDERIDEWFKEYEKTTGSYSESRLQMTNNPNLPYLKFYEIKNYRQIWIGKSPKNNMTKFSGGFGPKWDGNTILVETDINTYIWIGNNGIKQFKTNNPIVDFVSPIGNSQVPYPWAIDDKNNYYLMLDDIRVHFKNKLNEMDDPYDKYYHEISSYESEEYYAYFIRERD
jgi:hypothetical protein